MSETLPIKTDDDRAKLRKRMKEALAEVEKDYGITFSFGRIDYQNRWEWSGGKLRVYMKPVN